jgi:hypothetical protein
MERHKRFELKRRHVRQRAEELLGRLDRMDDEELRWTVRLFADCLPPAQRAACLGGYEERWGIDRRRAFLAGFIPRYAQLALAALDRAEAADDSGLAALTEEDLQGMSLAEKWSHLAAHPDALHPDLWRRELARLFMCKSFDLFHDPGLCEAVVEYPAYHRVRDALEALPDPMLATLVDRVVREAAPMRSQAPIEVEDVLARIRELIGHHLGIAIPLDRLFAGQMLRLPLDHPDEIPESGGPGARPASWESPGVDLQTALLIVADLMTQRELEDHLLPLRRRYRTFTDVPEAQLRALLSRVWALLGDRRLTDFAERYRSGRMIADRKLPADVWGLLPEPEKLAILERDNRAMDHGQLARHLAKIFFSFQYETLFDTGFHVDLLRSPRYQGLVNRLTDRDGESVARTVTTLTYTVTRQMLDLERLASEARRARLQEIRALIAAALDLPDDLTYPARKEGRA